jgi:hypothetical protein
MNAGTIFAGTVDSGVFRSSVIPGWIAVGPTGLDFNDIWALAVNGNGDVFAAVGYHGIFLSTNNGGSWNAIGLTNYTVYALAESGGTVFAGTMGGGVWRRPLSEMVGVIGHKTPQSSIQPANLRISSASRQINCIKIAVSLSYAEHLKLRIYDLSGHEVENLANKNFGVGLHTFTWDTRNISTVCYTVGMQAGEKRFVKSILIFH